MARSKSKEKEKQMTIYFDKRAFEQKEEENQEELEILKKREEGAAAIVATVLFFTKPLVFMLLWNWLMPGIFGLATIGYLKSFGLYLIARIIIDKND
ncbi:hypothetical protein RW291109_215 [Cyanophage S-RIM12_RW_29_1109]|uniref:Uncharacterized protein n=8 Tax=Brizovirus TaxID=2733098 RepID=A0A1D7STG8_9CAUD|nr:hypothetical protein Syn33_226 [Prochlorococcus phage Syn33]YP_009779192.1 hypothetical protein HOQ64_gp022 [Cyanophage S-RIM12 isolate RW_01_0310]YP_009779407.1 hypothetical protein HOQ65_gp023 [Cyanophage S-RIM12 isolate RW_06_0310]YP_009779622.1 hypothetical protein HOQ66_gp023 [Cyanophage S-RIM12 isolate W1_08_0910]AOO15272.1 hypothetical protein Np140310_214 [Cyanophage S-RIM12_Np_14_0310]AOO15484.1 hypothetical protein Np150310_211 [Cyanophage S-RIM12_Np_15_0310]AOO15699.1 hypothetic